MATAFKISLSSTGAHTTGRYLALRAQRRLRRLWFRVGPTVMLALSTMAT